MSLDDSLIVQVTLVFDDVRFVWILHGFPMQCNAVQSLGGIYKNVYLVVISGD